MIIYESNSCKISLIDVKKIHKCVHCGNYDQEGFVEFLIKPSLKSYYHVECVTEALHKDMELYKIPKKKIGVLSNNKKDKAVAKKILKNNGKIIAKILYIDGYIYLDHPYDLELINKYKFFKKFQYRNNVWSIHQSAIDSEIMNFILKLQNHFGDYQWNMDEKTFLFLKNKNIEIKERMNKARELKKIKDKNDTSFIENLDLSFSKIEIENSIKKALVFLKTSDGSVLFSEDYWDYSHKSITTMMLNAKIENKKTLFIISQEHINKLLVLTQNIINEKGFLLTNENIKFKELNEKIIFFDIFHINKLKDLITSKNKPDIAVIYDDLNVFNSAKKDLIFELFGKINQKIIITKTLPDSTPYNSYNIFKFLKKDLFPNKKIFSYRYCDPKETNYGTDFSGRENITEFLRKISPYYFSFIDNENKQTKFHYNIVDFVNSQKYKNLDLELRKSFFSKQYNKINKLDENDITLLKSMIEHCSYEKYEYLSKEIDMNQSDICFISQSNDLINNYRKLNQAFNYQEFINLNDDEIKKIKKIYVNDISANIDIMSSFYRRVPNDTIVYHYIFENTIEDVVIKILKKNNGKKFSQKDFNQSFISDYLSLTQNDA